jgi:hypothetical protein
MLENQESIFVGDHWQPYPRESLRKLRLPLKYSYFVGGDVFLRTGIIASAEIPREQEFLMAGILWANRLSNGAKTVLYFVAPDFSPFFLLTLNKIGGNLVTKGVYWREKLQPSLYLVPERMTYQPVMMGEKCPRMQQWSRGLNSLAVQQLLVMLEFFQHHQHCGLEIQFKQQSILIDWGNNEIAEIRRKGKKIELTSKCRWEKDPLRCARWKKIGWVDLSGQVNQEFQQVIQEMLAFLQDEYFNTRLHAYDKLKLLFAKNEEQVKSLWGEPWPWPWLPKDRHDVWLAELSRLYFFQDGKTLRVIHPILEHAMQKSCLDLLLASVLERSYLLKDAKTADGQPLAWDGRIIWLTTVSVKEDLLRWQCWLKRPEQFQISVLANDWERSLKLFQTTG